MALFNSIKIDTSTTGSYNNGEDLMIKKNEYILSTGASDTLPLSQTQLLINTCNTKLSELFGRYNISSHINDYISTYYENIVNLQEDIILYTKTSQENKPFVIIILVSILLLLIWLLIRNSKLT